MGLDLGGTSAWRLRESQDHARNAENSPRVDE
jgi:hypothetical protein